ncbi:cytochrome b/b6 domain-containing protein [Azospirillum sp. TSO22-1]|uniref:cytochrome b/b6 domain-containing protein n=1 Tax=Azospirillum sp. TSO22-1 TaxID=716789 RepID=UPI000D60C678|nr:cytochrome b/b6 domain-containing protein [Azospirillum sp. TSO22-1]PWC34803.1 cytochrome B [Azospirillum sp. TSO22-1]
MTSLASSPSGEATIRVWDPFVRAFHWSVAGACAVDLTVLDDGKLAHRGIGYGVLALVGVRLVWGVVGTRHARFADFVPGPRALLAYLGALLRGREPRFVGHNPAAAMMILTLLALLIAIGATGWMQTLDAFWGVAWVETLHGGLANLLVVLVAVHVAAAVLESLRHGENLVLAMVTGRKRR